MAGKKDDRINQRIPIQLLVDYRSPNGSYLFDFCRDLGTGGVFIETSKPLDMGSEVKLTFTLPDSKETLEASGKVIWVQTALPEKDLASGMGVQFDEFSADQRKTMENFIERYHGGDSGESTKPA
ncbi:TIGR02266 family protein [Pseudobacteriovorax antillogorgiicola]|uniref:Type IV pilus assembly protein PilZ n=1 Tax=Pseudobacteriovorax antillogorgiicola TaxID=1513793 RepID=A0A1Y6CAZ2_9BACT|nr:TIGR02266 family protein [Pseudobacteriovorax antillogorgiicola]TCS48678.1 type IV pilus assembly protein PilZ [Pseudobacteriovorax antillogorgiicola]SMF54930.1 type IV pilus assembly protein PilZ [Pseudobacteriovorax antillogorgiicola]